ncbi:mitochondrial heat shock protein Hsp10 [Polyrhizophydium stewartii]|uniref:Mitochondrial heat shock protein Hsp10 n=1 Tax=Polyrhizophydium stewartii TaxID=2732419 RepID=A0ABR4NHC8_9FUNG
MSSLRAAAKRIVPLFDRVLVQRIKPAERTASGIFIPEKAQESLNEAVVVAVGPGAPDKDGVVRPVSVKEGEHVLLPPFGGNAVKVGDTEYTLYRDSELLAKLEH